MIVSMCQFRQYPKSKCPKFCTFLTLWCQEFGLAENENPNFPESPKPFLTPKVLSHVFSYFLHFN